MHKIALVKDLFFKAKILETAKQLNLQIAFADSFDGAKNALLVIIDLEDFGANGIKEFKEKNPGSKVIGFLSHINIKLKLEAEGAGCIVFSRSEFSKKLPELLR